MSRLLQTIALISILFSCSENEVKPQRGDVRIGMVGLDGNGNRVTSMHTLAWGVSGQTVYGYGQTVFTPNVDIEYVGIFVDVMGTLQTAGPVGKIYYFLN